MFKELVTENNHYDMVFGGCCFFIDFIIYFIIVVQPFVCVHSAGYQHLLPKKGRTEAKSPEVFTASLLFIAAKYVTKSISIRVHYFLLHDDVLAVPVLASRRWQNF